MEQYDEKLGGKTPLPFLFNVEEYVAGHIEELNALTNAIENPSKTKLVFQRLPKHMRRRVMSHNVKRMPRRLREAHGKYLEKQNLKVSKRPSRKYRRRHSNLLTEYNRRQRQHVWLETHIWHAKRFAMRPLWGYKLAERPNEKSYRACERALERHCLLQDISYLVCIELSGPELSIVQGLDCHMRHGTGFSPGAKFYLNGCKEGHVMFYQKNRFPFGALGRVRFLWRPKENLEGSRQLWIWAHPSYHDSVIRELIATFSLNPVTPEAKLESAVDSKPDETYRETEEPMDVSTSSPSGDKHKRRKSNSTVESTKLALRNLAHHQVASYAHPSSGVRLSVLKDVLNRFELRGPLSGAILARALTLYERTEEDSPQLCTSIPAGLPSSFPKGQNELSPSIPAGLTSSLPAGQNELSPVWRLLQSASPSQFPPRSVLGAVIRDPRFNMPAQKSRSGLNPCSDEDIVSLATLPPHLSHSPLWDPALRHWCSTSKLSTHQVNQILSARLVPGVPCPRELKHASPLPLILIQQEAARSDLKTVGYGSGWDIVFPTGWSMPLLLGLIMQGARVGGLREALHLSSRMQTEPALSVDMAAWAQFEAQETNVARETYFKKPPKNRPNFIRLGVPSPFCFPWTVLLNDWKTNVTHLEGDRKDSTSSNVQEFAMDSKHEKRSTVSKVYESLDARGRNESKEIESIEAMDIDDTAPFFNEQKQRNKKDLQQQLQTKHSLVKQQQHQKTQQQTSHLHQQQQYKNDHQQKTSHEQQHSNKSLQNTPTQQKENPTIPSPKDYYVLRDKQLIETINDHIRNIHRKCPTEWNHLESLWSSIPHRNDCLLQVNLEMVKRGTMDKYTSICLPTEEELARLNPGSNGSQTTFRGFKRRGRGNGKQCEREYQASEDSKGNKGNNESWKKRGKHGRKKPIGKTQGAQDKPMKEVFDTKLPLKVLSKNQQQSQSNKKNVNRNLSEKSHWKDHQQEQQQQLKHNPLVKEDFHKNQTDPMGIPIREPPHNDPNSRVRKQLRSQHKALLTRLKRRRVRAKKRGPNAFETPRRVKRKVSPSQEIVEMYKSIMERLWVPNVVLKEISKLNHVNSDEEDMEESSSQENRDEVVEELNMVVEENTLILCDKMTDKTTVKTDAIKATSSNLCDKMTNVGAIEETCISKRTSSEPTNLSIEEDSVGKNKHRKLESYLNSLKRVSKRENNTSEKQDERKTNTSKGEATNLETETTHSECDGKIKDSSVESPKPTHQSFNSTANNNKRTRTNSDNSTQHKRQMKDFLKFDKSEEDIEVDEDIQEDDQCILETQSIDRSTMDTEDPNTNPASTKDTLMSDSKVKHSMTSQPNNFSPSDVISRLQPIRSLRFHASHQLFGFVTSRRYHATAHCAQGCVTLNGFIHLSERLRSHRVNRVLVLVRQTKHVEYHWARMSLV